MPNAVSYPIPIIFHTNPPPGSKVAIERRKIYDTTQPGRGNSGHTFGEKEFRGTNALLFPRLGDYAVVAPDGAVAVSGFFNENWQL